ncbi:hypothetical protein E3Q22_02183 [Wallemia mellicola]|uniref:Copper-fist domain-containing protein n=1 Tax=Wallemia mellicola TaxID=1708541 RepID=A0A4T0MAP1_9BASI|nr:hypothetical protein E3Q22_02183 [Wallemia mellicola]
MVASHQWSETRLNKGHRSSSCTHDDRPLFEVKRKGRPPAQCPKCKQMRRNDKGSNGCICPSESAILPKKDGPPPRKLKKGERAPLPEKPHYPNGLKDAYSTLVPLPTANKGEPSTVSLERLMNPCKCKVGGRCNCSAKKREILNDMLPSITDVIGKCACGPTCACPGCLTHGNPPLPLEEESATCGCDEIDVQGLLNKTQCGNLEEFLHKASSLVPYPPQGLNSTIESYVDGKAFGLQSWQQLYDPRNKGITRLPPLETECCGGSCQCQEHGVDCKCEENCCGCCTSCNCEGEADKKSKVDLMPPPPPIMRTSTQEGSSCCSKGNNDSGENNNGFMSPTTLTKAISQPNGLKIPQQLVSPPTPNNHWFPKFIPQENKQDSFLEFL